MNKFCALLIDDEEELVSTLTERLEFRGIEAEYAVSGSEAIAKMRTKPYDVVVVDMKMPGLSGLDLVKILQKEHPSLPIIMITGHGAPADEQVEIPAGVFDYLPKPVSIEVLIKKMSEAVGGKA